MGAGSRAEEPTVADESVLVKCPDRLRAPSGKTAANAIAN
jgi:hypothetical protein